MALVWCPPKFGPKNKIAIGKDDGYDDGEGVGGLETWVLKPVYLFTNSIGPS
jgi:hypothetical protein